MVLESFVIRRYLRIKHQGRLIPLITVLAAFGVALGVMVLFVVAAVTTGFQSELKKRILGIEAHMIVMRYNEWIRDYRQDIERIEKNQNVESVSPFVFAQGIAQSSGTVVGIQLRGIDPATSGIGNSLAALRRRDSKDIGGERTTIVLGKALADKLRVKTGDTILLMVSGTREISLQQLPKMHQLTVVGAFETGMHQYDSAMGFLDMRQLQRLIGVGDLATGIEIRLKNPDQVEAVAQELSDHLGFQYWTTHWKQMHRNLFTMLAMQKVVMYVIMTLIIIVAAFNIASALIMMVKEKNKEIAILKTMGAQHRAISRIFLVKGFAIGIIGIGVGFIAGLTVCTLLARYPFIELPGDVYFLTTLPVEIHYWDMVIISLGTMVICGIASLFPARQAARMNPVDAFRYG